MRRGASGRMLVAEDGAGSPSAEKGVVMFDTIVWATDASPLSDATLPLVTQLAGIHGSQIVAVHVNEVFAGGRFGGGPLPADEDELQARIEGQVADLRAAGFAVQLEIVTTRRTNTAELIAEAAATAGADLIVVGTHGYGMAETLLHGSVAKALTHTAHCPVLTVPPIGHELPAPAEKEHALAGA
jgi:nucleotide-binding universal stress UspA family protein